jgi:hypothetical protein
MERRTRAQRKDVGSQYLDMDMDMDMDMERVEIGE